MTNDLANLVSLNLFVKLHAKVVTSELVHIKGALKIHLPLDSMVGYVQEEDDLVRILASIQSLSLQYKIQHETMPDLYPPEVIYEGTSIPRSSDFVTNSLVRMGDPIYTDLLSNDPLPPCADAHQASQRCKHYEFDLTCPLPQIPSPPSPPQSNSSSSESESSETELDPNVASATTTTCPFDPLSPIIEKGPDYRPYPFPVSAELTIVAFCSREDADVPPNGTTYIYIGPSITVPLLPEVASGPGSLFATAQPPILIPLEVECLKKRLEEINDLEVEKLLDASPAAGSEDDESWCGGGGVKDVPKGLRVQLCL